MRELTDLLYSLGAAEAGFSEPGDSPFEGLDYAVTVAVSLFDPIMDQVINAPTHTYFQHYRAVNALIDQMTLRAALFLEAKGYNAAPIPASQSIADMDESYSGLYPHKRAAVAAGLGAIGKSALFISFKNGTRVRLGTIFTDYPLPTAQNRYVDLCGDCRVCVSACPAMAIKGQAYRPGMSRSDLYDAHACSVYMKEHFQMVGRGAVCGICAARCPQNKK